MGVVAQLISLEGHKGKILDFAAVEAERSDIIVDYHFAKLPRDDELCDEV